MNVRDLKVGQRFFLNRTAEVYTYVACLTVQNKQKHMVDKDGVVSELNHQCGVTPICTNRGVIPLQEQILKLESQVDELTVMNGILLAQQQKETKIEPDWANLLERLVFVRDNIEDGWEEPRILTAYTPEDTYPFRDTNGDAYTYARLYEGPTVPNFIPYTGQEIEGDGPWLILVKNHPVPIVVSSISPHHNVAHYTELKVVV